MPVRFRGGQMSIRKALGTKQESQLCAPLQCMDCAFLTSSNSTRCEEYPEGIPSTMRTILCPQHEYRLHRHSSRQTRLAGRVL